MTELYNFIFAFGVILIVFIIVGILSNLSKSLSIIEKKITDKLNNIIENLLKKIFIKLNMKYLLYVLISATAIVLFYWFQYRPSKILSHCNWKAKESVSWRITKRNQETYQINYESCLHENGLK